MVKFSGKVFNKIKEIKQSGMIDKKSIKRIASMIASGFMVLNFTTVSAVASKNVEQENPYKMSEEYGKDKDFTESEKNEVEEFRKQLEKQIKSSHPQLDSKYISGIYINGSTIRVKLIDGSYVEGEIESLTLGELELEDFYYEYNGHLIERESESSEYDKTENKSLKKLEIEYSSKIKIRNEFKYFVPLESDFINLKEFFELSEVAKVWVGGNYITEDILKEISSSKNLKSLYLTNRMFGFA